MIVHFVSQGFSSHRLGTASSPRLLCDKRAYLWLHKPNLADMAGMLADGAEKQHGHRPRSHCIVHTKFESQPQPFRFLATGTYIDEGPLHGSTALGGEDVVDRDRILLSSRSNDLLKRQ
jgi:hypothetical protein